VGNRKTTLLDIKVFIGARAKENGWRISNIKANVSILVCFSA
jgi:hypothetical protein